MQSSDDRIRVNAQLIDAETGVYLWADRFDKPLANLFDMQDEIVAHLARKLDEKLIAVEARRGERSRPANPELAGPFLSRLDGVQPRAQFRQSDRGGTLL